MSIVLEFFFLFKQTKRGPFIWALQTRIDKTDISLFILYPILPVWSKSRTLLASKWMPPDGAVRHEVLMDLLVFLLDLKSRV